MKEQKQQAEYIHELPVIKIHESELNPRRTIDQAKLNELANSIKAQGVLEPIMVRPQLAAGQVVPGIYELVAGQRRLQASIDAGLNTIPAIVRDMTDKEVLEAALTENAQREDVHPLEQAEALGQLHENHGVSKEELAVRMGKSKRWVETQLQLRKLGKAGRKAFLEGKLNPSVALVLARIADESLQDEALKNFSRYREEDGGITYRDALWIVERDFMLQLKDAPFDRNNAELVPGAGSCLSCPKRTGAQPELFADIKSKDTCTDPPCFKAKTAAHQEQVLAEAKAKGREVLTPAEAKKVWPNHYSSPTGYLEPTDNYDLDPKGRPIKQLLGKKLAEIAVTAINPHTNQVKQLIPRDALKKALHEVGHDFKKPKSASKSSSSKKPAKPGVDLTKVGELARQQLFERAMKNPGGIEFLRIAAHGAEGVADSELCERVGVKSGWNALSNWIDKKATEEQLRGFIVEASVCELADPYGSDFDPVFKAACKTYGVDLKALKQKLKAELEAKKKNDELDARIKVEMLNPGNGKKKKGKAA